MKAKMMEYKRQKDEDEAFLEHQRRVENEEDKSRQRQVSAREIAKFRQRVRFSRNCLIIVSTTPCTATITCTIIIIIRFVE